MKRLIPAIAILLLLWHAPSLAQGISNQNLKVTVPFDFTYNDITYPSGQYIIKVDAIGDKILIGNSEGWITISRTMDILRSNSSGDTHLVFSEKDGKHYLHQVWIAGESHGHDLIHKPIDGDAH